MHVMIFGAAGMIGRKLIQNLARNGRLGSSEIEALTLVDVTPVDKPAAFAGRVSVANLDISDPTAVSAVIARRPDVIFHLAAVVSAEAEAELEKGYRVNLDGARSVLEAARREGKHAPYRPRVVFSSSIAVFGAPFPEMIGDEFFTTPLTSYGAQKAMVELLLCDYSRHFIDAVAIRLQPSVSDQGSRTRQPQASSQTFCGSRLSAKRPCCRFPRTCAIGSRARAPPSGSFSTRRR